MDKDKIKRITIFIGVIIVSGYMTMVYLLKGKQVIVPDVKGRQIDEARKFCLTKELYIKKSGEKFDENIPEGYISSQDPLAGEYVKQGRTIFITISRGLKMVTVPDLKEESVREAKIRLFQNNLTVGSYSKVHSKDVSSGLIITQNPPPNLSVKRNTTVNLLISTGEKEKSYIMPNLVQKKFSLIKRALIKASLPIKTVNYVYQEGLDKDIIVEQFPLAGARIKKGDSVTLTVNLKESDKVYKLINLVYNVPKGGLIEKKIRVVVLDNDGTREVCNEMRKSGSTIEKSIKVSGETILQIFVNNELVEERKYD
ncbi:MAG: PASTA domain-containing protein [Candidatus Firestonebacteria bacterium]